MSEKLCLQWNGFNKNVNSAFGRLRCDKEFTDVTLACEDGKQMEAHKVILAVSSSFFEKVLKKNKHPHPLIYLKGFQSQQFLSILDFLYFGEANIHQEDLDSFLAIAEEIQLEGLTGHTSKNILEEQEKPKHSERGHTKSRDLVTTESTNRRKDPTDNAGSTIFSNALAASESATDLQLLDEKVKSMMEKGQKMIPRANGTPKQDRLWVCKVCEKEGIWALIRDHIEANHLEGMSLPCDFCDKTCPSRAALRMHKNKFHK